MKPAFLLTLLISPLFCFGQIALPVWFDDGTYGQYVFIYTTHYNHNIWQVGKPGKVTFTSAPGGVYFLRYRAGSEYYIRQIIITK